MINVMINMMINVQFLSSFFPSAGSNLIPGWLEHIFET